MEKKKLSEKSFWVSLSASIVIIIISMGYLLWRVGVIQQKAQRAQIISEETQAAAHASVSKLTQYTDREKTTITIADISLGVEVVNSPESTQQGLSGRDQIGSDGMLFVFPTKEVRHFWMPDMKFNIDIVWISDEKVVGVLEDVSKPTAMQKVLPTYSSGEPVNVVLELPAFRAAELGIQPGSRVIY